jgi:hypothetical protein
MLARDLLPARFLVRRGRAWRRINAMTASASFLDRALYTLKELRLDLVVNWEVITTDELLALPWVHPLWGYDWPATVLRDAAYSFRSVANFLSIADVLWYRGYEDGGYDAWRKWCFYSLPITPPSPRGIDFNYRRSRLGPANPRVFKLAAGTLKKSHWNAFWRNMHPRARELLTAAVISYGPHDDRAGTHRGVRSHDRPLRHLDAAHYLFPWRFATFAGVPLAEYTVRKGRTFLAEAGARTAIVPDWDLKGAAGTADVWQRTWTSSRALPVSPAALSDLWVFLHRRCWLSQIHLRRANYADRVEHDDEDDDALLLPETADEDDASSDIDVQEALAAGLDRLDDHDDDEDVGDEDDIVEAERLEPEAGEPVAPVPEPPRVADVISVPRQTDDEILRRDYRLGTCPMRRCAAPDSVAHGYVQCPEVRTVWLHALRVLDELAPGTFLASPFRTEDVIHAWRTPRRQDVVPHPERVALWQAVVIHVISRRRHAAIAASAQASQRKVIDLSDRDDGLNREIRHELISGLLRQLDAAVPGSR